MLPSRGAWAAAIIVAATFVIALVVDDGSSRSGNVILFGVFLAGAAFTLGLMASPPYSPSAWELYGADEPDDTKGEEAPPPEPVYFSPRNGTALTNEYRDQIRQFVQRVMYLDPEELYLTDWSTIENIQRGHENKEYYQRTRDAYGVDISDISPPYLWAIAKRIQDDRFAWTVRSARPPRDSILADSETERFDAGAED